MRFGARVSQQGGIELLLVHCRAMEIARAEPHLANGLLRDAEIEPDDYVRSMLDRLKGIGVQSVVVVPLENGARGFSVAKIIVEDLESPAGPRKTRFGPRAHAFARSRQ